MRSLLYNACVAGALLAAGCRCAPPCAPAPSPVAAALARVDVSSDGAVRMLDGTGGCVFACALSDDDPASARAALDRLAAAIAALSALPAADGETGAARGTLELSAPASAAWSRVLGVLAAAASPSTGIARIRFLLDGAPRPSVENEILRDPWSSEDDDEGLKVQLSCEAGGHAVAQLALMEEINLFHEGVVTAYPVSWTTAEPTYEEIRSALAPLVRGKQTVESRVEAASMSGACVRYGDVFAVLRALRDERVLRVRFWGTVCPRPR